jgi:hypothetical protein
MAATHLREAYDCIVLGSGRTANQLAAAVARSGRQTLQLMRESTAAHSWLHPRRNTFSAELADGQRLPLSGVGIVNAAGKRLTAIKAAASLVPQHSSVRPTLATFLKLPSGCRVACEVPREIRLNGALPPTTIRANSVIFVGSAPNSGRQSAIGGIYRDVSTVENEDRQAMLFATQRGGEVFWLVPMAGALWSIGLFRSHAESPEDHETLADEFEEALVACPALTQRLISAQLVGSLHYFAETTQAAPPDLAADVLTLPDYNAWLDPVFSSSDWLGDELATQFAQLLTAENGSADRFAEWRQHWHAVEQLTRERIAPWYQQHEVLPAALHDHAQREWYEKLLTGGSGERRGVGPT